MDTSETYIKMNLKAWPDLRPFEAPFSRRERMLYVVDGKVGVWNEIINLPTTTTSSADKAFPLWEQDQLQEIIPKQENFRLDCAFFRSYIFGYGDEFPDWQVNSWEQLWLAFVMKEKYNKVWNGEEWV